MGKTYVVRIKQTKARIYMPIKRADVFGDKRTKRIRTRGEQIRKAIKEYS